jgi:hypothetical protein
MAEHWELRLRVKKRSAKAVSDMFGCFLREGGILVIVFGILDRLNRGGQDALSRPWVYGCFGVGVGALLTGMIFCLLGQQKEGE